MTPGPVPSRATDLAMVGDEQRIAMVDLAHPERPPMVLEGPAAMIWSLVDGRRSTDEIVTELAEMYAAPVDGLRHDVETFLRDLSARDLVTLAARGDA